MSKDISRYLLQPRKRYSSVRMQQGRVILDSDWNESERIDDEQARRTLVDLICSKGTSNRGFRVRNVVGNVPVTPPGADPVATYDFEFENGSFYIGGLRFETETDPDEGPETFLKQSDWLQIDALAANLPTLPVDLPAGRPRHDLVYLRGWEQCVTAVEDSELRERALGGPDTSLRIRNMRRVEVLTDVPDTCAVAFNRLVEQLTKPTLPDTGEPHEFDRQNSELKSNARIKVTPDPEAITEDPCKPAVPGGYLGADNQTIRVQLTATDRFIWSYDNASPIYRVQVDNIPDVPAGVDGARRKIKFLTLPRDQAAQPLAGQAVEIIPWGSLLPNKEKVAEFQGEFFTVETSFDPEDNSLTITEPVFEEWVEWLADHSQFWSERDEPEHQQYFYLRLWTGGSGDPVDPDHKFTPGTPVALEGTGLSVTFSDSGLAGDFWIIAARPNTPELVVPWELLDEAPPAGPRYFFAPLALISWTLGQNNQLQASVHDCRERFRPLCDLGGCCTVTVGDGVSSRGDFDSVEDALDHLPDAGGEVCLLAGQHRVNAVLIGRRNITIKGCGRQTRVIPREVNRTGAIFRVVDSQGITLRDMDIVTFEGTAIVLEGSKPDALKEVEISHTRIIAFKQAIQVLGGTGIHIHENRIRMLDKDGAGNAIQILAEDSVIERNDIGVVPAERTPPPDQPDDDDTPDPTEPCADPEIIFVRPGFLTVLISHIFSALIAFLPGAPFRARGGIQILPASERIKVLDNVISGGADNGITLGGLPASPEVEPVPPPPVIETREELIRGDVLRLPDEAPQPGIDLTFTRADGKEFKTTSKPDGSFEVFNTVAAKHEVTVTTPGVRIERIEFEDRGSSRFHTIMIVREERPVPEPALPFIYEIQIDRNEISHMGLSGIGYPIVRTIILSTPGLTIHNSAIANILALLGNPVLTLGIHRNHIHDCLQNPFEGDLRAEAVRRGFGGISLGFCENVTISANRIEKNGRSHINPAVGIFMRLGAKVDIYHNHIFDNGPFTPSEIPPNLEVGIRGGIMVLVASIGIIEAFLENQRSPDMKMHAARIHDNIVHQPVGHALRLLGIGATSICDNRFISDISGPQDLERLVGLVYVLTTGGIGTFFASPTLFNSNQSHLGERAASLMSQSIITTDDIGYDGNQSVAMTDGFVLNDNVSMFANTFLVGRTLRATDSRFKEPPGSRRQAIKFSLVTRTSLLNNTNDNQGDHCILAFNTATSPVRPPNEAGNQVVDDRLCPRLNNSIKAPVSSFPVTATRNV